MIKRLLRTVTMMLISLVMIISSVTPGLAIVYNPSGFTYYGTYKTWLDDTKAAGIEEIVFQDEKEKYGDYFSEAFTIEITDDSHDEYVIVTLRHYWGHRGSNSHSNYQLVPGGFSYTVNGTTKEVASWFISGSDNVSGSESTTGYRIRNQFAKMKEIPNVKLPKGVSMTLKAYDKGLHDDTITSLKYQRDIKFEYSKYQFKVDALLDNVNTDTTEGYGTFDITINGTKTSGLTDKDTKLYYNDTYTISGITANAGKQYNGVTAGSLSGTIKKDTSVRLKFDSLKTTLTVNPNGGLYNGTSNNTVSSHYYGDETTIGEAVTYEKCTIKHTYNYIIQT